MQTAAVTSHAALTASPRFSATIAKATAPSRATATHKSFVCHTLELFKVVLIDFLPVRASAQLVSSVIDYLSLIKINAVFRLVKDYTVSDILARLECTRRE